MYTGLSYEYMNSFKEASRAIEQRVEIEGVWYESDSIIEISIDDSCIDGGEFTIGTVISTRLDLKLKTTNILPNNAEIKPYVRCVSSRYGVEWIPLGVFYIDRRSAENNILHLVCYDKLYLTQQEYRTTLTGVHSGAVILSDICDTLGIERAGITLGMPYDIEKGIGTGKTFRDVLSWMAFSEGTSFKMDRLGVMVAIDFKSTNSETAKLDMYMACKQTNPTKKYTRVVWRSFDGAEISMGEGGDESTLFGETPTISHYYLERIYSKINGIEYVPLRLTWRGLPYLDSGDRLTVILADDKPAISTIILNQSITIKSGIVATVDSPSSTKAQSEFGDLSGKLGRKVNVVEERVRNIENKSADDLDTVKSDIVSLKESSRICQNSINSINSSMSNKRSKSEKIVEDDLSQELKTKINNSGSGSSGKDGIDGVDGKDGINGTNGKDGKDGESAYEIAIKNGFIGTELEWLESLKGTDGSGAGEVDLSELLGMIETLSGKVTSIDARLKALEPQVESQPNMMICLRDTSVEFIQGVSCVITTPYGTISSELKSVIPYGYPYITLFLNIPDDVNSIVAIVKISKYGEVLNESEVRVDRMIIDVPGIVFLGDVFGSIAIPE